MVRHKDPRDAANVRGHGQRFRGALTVSYLSRTLERVREDLRGRRTPGKHSNAYAFPAAPPAPRRRPTPDVWGARLVIARRRRAERHAPPIEAPQPQGRAEWFPPRDWEAEEAWERTGALVRPYGAALGEAPRNGRTGAQAAPWAGPWGNAS